MATTERLSLYLTDSERSAVRQAAQRLGQSENYVARLALRKVLGLSLSELNHLEISHMISTRDPHTSTHI